MLTLVIRRTTSAATFVAAFALLAATSAFSPIVPNTLVAAPQTLLAPTATNDLNGYWRMKMDINADGAIAGEGTDDPNTACLFNIASTDGNTFVGNSSQCGIDRTMQGSIYGNSLVNAVMYNTNSDDRKYYVFSGKIMPDGTIRGYYYTEGCISGDFQWIRTDASGKDVSITDAGEQLVPSSLSARLAASYPKPTTNSLNSNSMRTIATTYSAPTRAVAAANDPNGVLVGTYDGDNTNTDNSLAAKPVEKVTEGVIDTPAAKVKAHNEGRMIAEGGVVYHIVAAEETLYGIAKRYKITVDELMSWNAKADEKLKVNEKLRVSGM